MQTDYPAANYFPAPQGRAPVSQPTDAALRALTILQAALMVELVAGLVGGLTRAFFIAAGKHALGSTLLSGTLMTAIQLVFLGATVAELVALSTLAGAPPAARVAELARPALWLRAVGLVLSLVSWAMPYLLREGFTTHQLMQGFIYLGYIETVLGLVDTYLLVELLLRLRRFAAPSDSQLADSENLLRAGILGAMMLRILGSYAAYPLALRLFGSTDSAQWLLLAVRVPCSLLFYGLQVWLVQTTATALRGYQPATEGAAAAASSAAVPSGGAADADTSAAGYRNMLLGGLWAGGGIAVTALTYTNAHALGGRYAVAYGAIFFGIVQFVRGLLQLGGRR